MEGDAELPVPPGGGVLFVPETWCRRPPPGRIVVLDEEAVDEEEAVVKDQVEEEKVAERALHEMICRQNLERRANKISRATWIIHDGTCGVFSKRARNGKETLTSQLRVQLLLWLLLFHHQWY